MGGGGSSAVASVLAGVSCRDGQGVRHCLKKRRSSPNDNGLPARHQVIRTLSLTCAAPLTQKRLLSAQIRMQDLGMPLRCLRGDSDKTLTMSSSYYQSRRQLKSFEVADCGSASGVGEENLLPRIEEVILSSYYLEKSQSLEATDCGSAPGCSSRC